MPVVIYAEPSSKGWKIIHINIQFSNTLPFNGRVYGVTRQGRQLVQLYPHDPQVNPVVAQVPKEPGDPQSCWYYLVESMGTMLVAVLHRVVSNSSSSSSKACTLFKVDLCRRELTRVPSLGDRTLFLSRDQCLSVSAKDLPSISSNSVYIAMLAENPVTVYSLDDGSFGSTGNLSQIHGMTGLIQTSVRPFTLADHLATYCRHREWTRRLMFHECCFEPRSWSKMQKRFAAQDSEVVVPSLRGTKSQLKNGVTSVLTGQ